LPSVPISCATIASAGARCGAADLIGRHDSMPGWPAHPQQKCREFLAISTTCPVSVFRSALSGEVNAMTRFPSTRRCPVARIQAALIVVMTVAVVGTASARQTASPSTVRSENPMIADAIARGIERSPIFRRLIETINATDGLVYIDEGACGRGVRACLLHSVTISGQYRLLRIIVTTRKAPGCELVASIGHELQHALEALSDASVRSGSQIFHFFQREGPTDSMSLETNAAREMGLNVQREMCRRD
jgi:hypothetical protein